jgi:hypothetical protein
MKAFRGRDRPARVENVAVIACCDRLRPVRTARKLLDIGSREEREWCRSSSITSSSTSSSSRWAACTTGR